jgi:hypothetical protein
VIASGKPLYGLCGNVQAVFMVEAAPLQKFFRYFFAV